MEGGDWSEVDCEIEGVGGVLREDIDLRHGFLVQFTLLH